MNLLAFDTSTEQASITLSVNGAVYSKEHVGAQTHAQSILVSIDALLTSASVTLAELDGIVFGRGPGSFTGLRVACSIAKGLAYAHDLPVYPVSSLEAILWKAFSEEVQAVSSEMGVLAMIDARMNQVYWTFAVSAQDTQIEKVSFVKDIDLPETSSLCLVGVGWERYEHEFPDLIKKRIVKRVTIYPEALAMIQLVEHGFIKSVQAGEAMPIYIRDNVTS